jgi:Kef-type K+ transport system membrane component KefB
MFELTLIKSLGTMIVVSTVMVLLLRKAYIPNLVSYIIAGLILLPVTGMIEVFLPGEFGGQDVTKLEIIKTISEIGIALLLFLVGLELSLDKIKDVGKVAVVAGLGQVLFTAAGGFVISAILQFSVVESIFLAVSLTFSSTVVVVKLLDQKRELNSLYGRIAVGIFLVQDLVVIIFLTILTGLDGESALEFSEVAVNMVHAFLGIGLLLTSALLSSRYLLPKAFSWASDNSSEMLFMWALCWCFALVILAEVLGLSLEIGAFLAGLSLAQLPCSEDLHRRMRPLVNFFIAIFFISLGAQMEFSSAREHFSSSMVLSLFVLIGNPLIFIWIIAAMGYGKRTAFMTSVTVAQISEFSFIFASLGMTKGLIDESILSVIAVVGVVTIAVSSYMILYNEWLYEACDRLGLLRIVPISKRQRDETPPKKTEGHIIVIGQNSMGRNLVSTLHGMGEKVLAIDSDPKKLKGIPSRTMLGNVSYLTVLEEAHYDSAKLVISTLQIEEVNLLLAYRCKQLSIPIAIHAFDSLVIDDLLKLGVDYLIASKEMSIHALEKHIHEMTQGGAK